ncbi:MAG: nucleotidyltransferase domain-containing protein [Nitrososphaerota archaeon]
MADRALVRVSYLKPAEEYAAMLGEEVGDMLSPVFLFGSTGGGDFTAESDIDLLPVVGPLSDDDGLRHRMFNGIRIPPPRRRRPPILAGWATRQ